MNVVVGLSEQAFTLHDPDRWKHEMTVLPVGEVKLYDMRSFIVDELTAMIIIADFEGRGIELPIDFEHSSVTKAGMGEPAPAAGWITSLHWDPERGIVALVEWGPEALSMIKKKQYKYMSPVLMMNEDTNRPIALYSVALTNQPRINNQTELLAASKALTIDAVSVRNKTMPKTSKTAVQSWMQKAKDGRLKRVVMAEVISDEAIEGNAPEEIAGIDELLAAYRDVLENWGVEVPEGASGEDILMLMGELATKLYEVVDAEAETDVEEVAAEVGGGAPTEEAPTEEAPAAVAASLKILLSRKKKKVAPVSKRDPLAEFSLSTSVKTQLGLSAAATPQQVLASITELKGHVGFVPISRYNDLAKRIKTIEDTDRTAKVESALKMACAAHKLNSYDDEQMKWAREFAGRDPDGFQLIMSNAPEIVGVGEEVKPSPTSTAGKNERETLIASTLDTFRKNPRLQIMCSVKSFVNTELIEADMSQLTEDETTKLS